MDFEVEVTEEGCYVVTFELWWKTFGVSPDALILVNRDGWLQPYCLTANVRHKFRVTTSTPAPSGSTAPPPAAPGTHILSPLSGDWPEKYSIKVYYKIMVYYIGACSGGNCERITRAQLPAQLYLRLEGPNSGAPDFTLKPIYLASLDGPTLPEGEALATVGGGTPPTAFIDPGSTVFADIHEARGEGLLYRLQRVRNDDTFDAEGVAVSRFKLGDGTPRLTAHFHLKPTLPSLAQIGDALLDIDRAIAADDPRLALSAITGVIRHGRMTLFGRADTLSGYFIDNQYAGASRPGSASDFPAMREPREMSDSHPFGRGEILRSEKSTKVWMKDEWYVYLAAWVLAGTNYENGINDVIKDVLDPVINAGDCLKKIEILSHGGPLIDGTTGTETGSNIRMGANNLRSDDFDANGNVTNPLTKAFLDKLKAAVCPGGKLIFSACDQAVGNLLRDISKYIDDNVTVIGNRGLGIPAIEGDLHYVNGNPS